MDNQLLVKRSYLKELSTLSKAYAKDDMSYEVLKIKEWLMLWQLNDNYVDCTVDLDTVFDAKTESLVIKLQKEMSLEPTGIVDDVTWKKMIDPLIESFSINAYNKQTLRQKMKYFASKHLQFRASELDENNIGPWIRSYMGGWDGHWAYWCQGFACTILDQTFSSVGEYFDEYYANTFVCEDK